jgi:hypothetical protein
MRALDAWRLARLLSGMTLVLIVGGCAVVSAPEPPPTEAPATPVPPTPTPFQGFAPTLGEVATSTPVPTAVPTLAVPTPAGLSETTYQSKKFGYSVRVPNGWSVVPGETRPGDQPDEFNGPVVDDFTSRVTVRGQAVPPNVEDNRDWLNRQVAGLQERQLPLRVLRSVPVGDGTAALISHPDSTSEGQSFRVHQVNFVRDGRAWVISLATAERAADVLLPAFIEMHATFQPT